jgi:hypothetical protein
LPGFVGLSKASKSIIGRMPEKPWKFVIGISAAI